MNNAATISARALVILYTGTSLTEHDRQALQTVLEKLTAVRTTHVSLAELDTKDIGTRCVSFMTVEESHKTASQQAIESAVVYIGTKFSNLLTGPNKSYLAFITALTNAVIFAKINNSEPLLLKSVEIISTHSGIIPAELGSKYGFTKSIVSAIQTIDKQNSFYNVL